MKVEKERQIEREEEKEEQVKGIRTIGGGERDGEKRNNLELIGDPDDERLGGRRAKMSQEIDRLVENIEI